MTAPRRFTAEKIVQAAHDIDSCGMEACEWRRNDVADMLRQAAADLDQRAARQTTRLDETPLRVMLSTAEDTEAAIRQSAANWRQAVEGTDQTYRDGLAEQEDRRADMAHTRVVALQHALADLSALAEKEE